MAEAALEHHHAHHFKDGDHEFETCKQGMWLFLLQEVLFFTPLFVLYAILRGMYPASFHEGSMYLDPTMGALNTVILISSSLTMAMAVKGAQMGDKGRTTLMLFLTLVFASGFLVVKYFEYSHKLHLGITTAGSFSNTDISDPKSPLFFSLYYMMTGLHGIHVVGGMVVIFWIMLRANKGEFGPNYYTPVEMVGLYWHFVDLVWIYLFPMLYLM